MILELVMRSFEFGNGRRGGGRGGRSGGRYGRGGNFGAPRSERMLDKAEMQVLLLSLLDGSPKHGYEMIRAIKSLTEGHYAPSPGMVYPALNALADTGLATAKDEEQGRKSFTITAAGQSRLSEEADAVTTITERLKTLPASQTRTRAPIARALANLDLVLANLPADAGDEQIDQIVTLIDGAARQIERIA